MTKKEKVSIVRSDDFEEVDAALSEALASLEEANARVAQLLQSETCSQISEAAERKLAGGAAADDAPQGEHAADDTRDKPGN